MDYSKIIAVSGLQGLHELISSKNDGAIVRALDDKATKFVSSRIHNFSHLESIEIYTVKNNVNLVEILHEMQKSDKKLPDVKDDEAVKKYFESVYPDLDFDRVYSSDMKKIVKWFDILQKNKVEIKLSERPAEEEAPIEQIEETQPEPKKQKAAAAPKAARSTKEEPEVAETAKKKAAPKKKETVSKKAAEKPVKKAATKAAKPKEEKEVAPKKKAAPKKK